jgi:hypothetical protein
MMLLDAFGCIFGCIWMVLFESIRVYSLKNLNKTMISRTHCQLLWSPAVMHPPQKTEEPVAEE